jgi:hypothetical protein
MRKTDRQMISVVYSLYPKSRLVLLLIIMTISYSYKDNNTLGKRIRMIGENYGKEV